MFNRVSKLMESLTVNPFLKSIISGNINKTIFTKIKHSYFWLFGKIVAIC